MTKQMRDNRPYYVLGIMSAVTIVNFYDRFVVSILIEHIKRDMGLSDAQAGLVTGTAFALAYSLLAIPMAHFADKQRHVRVLGTAMIIWSVMTILCGQVQSFLGLLLARIGVAVGESGGISITHALVAEAFPVRRRTMALSILAASAGVGSCTAMMVGGVLAEHFGWRSAFWVGGIAGLMLAIVVLLTIQQPAKGAPTPAARPELPIGQAVSMLLRRRSLTCVNVGLSIAGIGGFAVLVWTPAFLMRKYGLGSAAVGVPYALAIFPASVGGLLLGGVIAERLERRDPRWAMWMPACACILSPFCILALFAAPAFEMAIILAAITVFISHSYTGPAYALIQNLSGAGLRSTGAAMFVTLVNAAGFAIGSFVPGLMSDLLAPRFGVEALGIALSALSVVYFIGAATVFAGTRTLQQDLAAANSTTANAIAG